MGNGTFYKYVILDDGFPIVFHRAIPHNTIKAYVGAQPGKVTGAGFFKFDKNLHVKCYGKSDSLGVCVSDEDEGILEDFFDIG